MRRKLEGLLDLPEGTLDSEKAAINTLIERVRAIAAPASAICLNRCPPMSSDAPRWCTSRAAAIPIPWTVRLPAERSHVRETDHLRRVFSRPHLSHPACSQHPPRTSKRNRRKRRGHRVRPSSLARSRRSVKRPTKMATTMKISQQHRWQSIG